MAALTITVGPLTSTIEVSDAKAQELLTDYAAAYGIAQTGAAQQRLDAVTRHIAQHVTEAANGYNQRAALEAERERVRAAVAARQWSSAGRK